MKKIFLLVLLCALSLQAKTEILFIGNSYTGGIRKTFDQLVKAENADLHVEYINPGGRQLRQHFSNPKVIAKIKSRKWDFVILQEQSQTPAYQNLRPHFYEASR